MEIHFCEQREAAAYVGQQQTLSHPASSSFFFFFGMLTQQASVLSLAPRSGF